MPTRKMILGAFENHEDWVGNNAAFTCPVASCGKVYIVSALIHKGGRECPGCRQSKAFVSGSQSKGGEARIEWPSN